MTLHHHHAVPAQPHAVEEYDEGRGFPCGLSLILSALSWVLLVAIYFGVGALAGAWGLP